jgi:hypothetical protein
VIVDADYATKTVLVPLRTGRGLNDRVHHMVRHRMNQGEQEMVLWSIKATRMYPPRPPCTVTLTRISPASRPLDDDNLRGALKNVRDAVAKWIGIDDGDDAVRYAYAQERGPWGVRVECK